MRTKVFHIISALLHPPHECGAVLLNNSLNIEWENMKQYKSTSYEEKKGQIFVQE